MADQSLAWGGTGDGIPPPPPPPSTAGPGSAPVSPPPPSTQQSQPVFDPANTDSAYAPPAALQSDQPVAAGQVAGGSGTATNPPPPPPPQKPSKPANFQLGALLPTVINIKLSAHQLRFDEQYFLHLLAGSISLTRDEKVRIIDSMPKLRQSQIDELIRIFEEERRKFAELGQEHVPQLEKLARQHYEDWVDIEMKQQQSSQAASDQAQADEIRKQLGL